MREQNIGSENKISEILQSAMAKKQKPTLVSYRINDFLEILGIGRTKFYEMLKEGQIKSVLVGGRRLVPRSEALRLIGETEREAA